MLYYDRNDKTEGIDFAKSNISKICTIFHYRIINHRFKFQKSVCNGSHKLTKYSINISDIAKTITKYVAYCGIIEKSSKSKVINLIKISVHEDWACINQILSEFSVH